jgi:hypothetical protein
MKNQRVSLALLLLGAALLVFVAATAQSAGAEAASATVSIIPNQEWTGTGIALTAGEALNITASGIIHFVAGTRYPASPAGTVLCLSGHAPGPFPAPHLMCYSLMGKIGPGGTPFEVSTSYSADSVATSGELYLGPNDNEYRDNAGKWVAVVTAGTDVTPTTVAPTTTTTEASHTTTTTTTTTTTIGARTTTSTDPPVTGSAGTGPAPRVVSKPSGFLAFTGLGPLGQIVALVGFLLLLAGAIFYFFDDELRWALFHLTGARRPH